MTGNCPIKGCVKPAEKKGWCDRHYRRWKTHGDPEYVSRAAAGEPLQWLKDHAFHTDDECLYWPFGINRFNGYAAGINFGGVRAPASRVMCILAHGSPRRPNLDAAHSCRNGRKACVNPKHLSWKTHRENEADKVIHGTLRRGEELKCSRLTERQVRKIRELCDRPGAVQKDIATKYGIARSAICRIAKRKAWAWLT